jgi:hypothetical protein
MASTLRILGALWLISGAILYLVQPDSRYITPLVVAGCVLVLVGRLAHRWQRRRRPTPPS